MDNATTRADRRDHGRKRNRTIAVACGAVVVVGAGVIGTLVLSGGGDDGSSASKTNTAISRATHLDVPLGDVSADSAGPALTVSAEQSQQVLDVLTNYVKDATVQPLRSGAPATADLATLFDATTLTSATTTDRGVVLDEDLPKVTGTLDVVSTPVAMVGLGDQSGNLTLISAAMIVDAKGQTAAKGGPLHIVRRADFVLAPDAAGTWKITSYNVVVTRDGAGLSPTTSTTTGTTTGAGAAK